MRTRAWRAALAGMVAVAAALPTVARPALGPRYGGEVRVGLPELPADAGPAVPHGRADRILAGLVHETLLGIDEEGRPRPALAQSWASAADGREWTLRLAPASFHDGSAVTAADAVRAIRRFLRSGSSAGAHLARSLEGGDEFRRAATEVLAGVTAPDESRIVLRLRETSALPLAALASPASAVVSSRGAGAGPFAPTTPPSARGLSATAFGRHVRGRPFLDVVRLVPAAADQGRTETAELGGGTVPAPSPSGLLLLILDPGAAPLADARVRALVAASVDRVTLARHFVAGGEPADTLLAPSLLPPLPGMPPASAPRASGPLAGRLTLRVGPDVPPSASRRVVAHLAALGLEVQAVPAPAAGPPGQARLVVWYPEVAEPGLALEELATLAGVAASEEVRGLLQSADLVRDADRRRADLQRAEEALRAAHVLVPLARLPLDTGLRAEVHGARTTATGALLLEDAWVEP